MASKMCKVLPLAPLLAFLVCAVQGLQQEAAAQTKKLVQFTTHSTHDWNPDWSPDGEWVAFESFRTGDREIYIQRLAGAAEHLHDLVDAAPAPLPGAVLDHRGFNTHVFTVVGTGGRLSSEGPQAHDVDVDVGEHPLYGLAFRDGPSVGNPLFGPFDGHVQGPAEDAQRH